MIYDMHVEFVIKKEFDVFLWQLTEIYVVIKHMSFL